MSKENTKVSSILSKIWVFCQTLRDDGVDYGVYLEQLTCLLFLKMADEYTKPPNNSTLTYQSKIYSCFNVVDKTEVSILQSFQQDKGLRQSVLKKAYCGELI